MRARGPGVRGGGEGGGEGGFDNLNPERPKTPTILRLYSD